MSTSTSPTNSEIGFNVFDLVYVMTQGGPVDATNVAMTDIYREAIEFYHF